MSFWPFRKPAPPEEKVARNLGGGLYEMSVYVAIAWSFEKDGSYRTNHKIFDNMKDAEDHAAAWKTSGEYKHCWAQHTGTVTVDVGLESLAELVMKRIAEKQAELKNG